MSTTNWRDTKTFDFMLRGEKKTFGNLDKYAANFISNTNATRRRVQGMKNSTNVYLLLTIICVIHIIKRKQRTFHASTDTFSSVNLVICRLIRAHGIRKKA